MKKWTFVWSSEESPLLAFTNYYKPDLFGDLINFNELIGNEYREAVSFSDKRFVSTYCLTEDLQKANDWGKAMLEPGKFDEVLESSNKSRVFFYKFIHELEKTDFNNVPKEKLTLLFKDLIRSYHYLINHFKYSRPEFFSSIDSQLKKSIVEMFPDGNTEEIFSILTTSPKLDKINKEEIDFLRIIAANNFSNEILWKHAKKYGFLFFNTYNKGEILEFLQEKVKGIPTEKVNERINQISMEKKELSEKQAKILSRLDGESKNLVYMFQEAGFDRLEIKSCWAALEFHSLEMLEKISSLAEISLEDFLSSYLPFEVVELIENGTKLSLEEVEKRKDFYYIHSTPEGFKLYSGNVGRNVLEEELGDSLPDKSVDELKGAVANPGLVKGKVRIVNCSGSVSELMQAEKEFVAGEIMITQMTQPNMVFMAKKASAIVTDEGGITSHASIISREIGIPCIVGTKSATQVFKDGDLIEVDANNGIVRKVEDKLTWNKDFYAKMDLFSMYLEADTSLSKEIKTIFKSPVKMGFRYVDKDYYYCVEDRNAIKKQLSENLIFNIENTNKVLKEVSNQFLDVCTNIHSLNLKNKINEELLQLYHRFCDVYAKTNAGWLHPLLIEELILSKIDEIIKSVIGPAGEFDLFNKVISSLLLSENESEMAKEKKELLNLIISNASDEELQKHADKYAYMGMVLLSGDPWTLGDLKKRISNIENPKEKLNELNHVCNDACKDRLSKIEDPEFWKLVELGRETSFLRTFHLEKTNEGCFYARRLFEKIAKRAELSYRDILHYTPQEIETFLINGNKVFKEEIQKRMGGYVVINKPDLKLYVGDGIDIFKEEHKTKLDDLNEIKGIIAQKGIVRGKAKVLLDPKDNDKVNSGDILIAELTTPNFIPAMEKASAFVTNIGGITSHAAIIAREMGKVCIVGTKHATQVFKDGDLVEVDANNGTVRKIKGEETIVKMILPTEEECMQYFEKYKVPQNIKGHCILVRNVAVFLAKKLKEKGIEINVELVDKMSLLHDLFKTATIENLGNHPHFDYTYTDEEIFAWKQLREKYSHLHESKIFPLIFGEKYPELSKAIKNSSDFFKEDKSIEEQVSHYADWRVDDDKKVVSLKSRIDILMDRYKTRGEDYWERREEIILRKEKEIFSHLNFRPEQLAEMIKNG